MDYEQRYNEALEKIKNGLQPLSDGTKISGVTRAFLEEVFPELKEGEDERIRKAILKMLHETPNNLVWVDYGLRKKDAIAWLEKQGKKKPTEWSEEDDAYKLFAISAVEDYYDKKNPLQKDLVDWLKSFKERLS